MRDPFSLDKLPEGAVLTRRFGVQQSSTVADGTKIQKFRPIDDFSESFINVTKSCDETILPMGIDQVCAGLGTRMRYCPGEQLSCKTVDLPNTFKNFPLSGRALQDPFICVRSAHLRPTKRWSCLLGLGRQ